jgi:hypothetical protein
MQRFGEELLFAALLAPHRPEAVFFAVAVSQL